jgi:hypothetical protein
MISEKRPKWDSSVAVIKGKQSNELVSKYQNEIQGRFQPDDLPQHKANVVELETRLSGQKENLVDQKSKTLGQNEAMNILHSQVIGIRGIVKSCNPAAEIAKSFGVGEKINDSKTSVISSAKIVMAGYSKNQEWCNTTAGILEDDIVEMNDLVNSINGKDDTQETSKFVRKSRTMDKNTLQRTIEDMVTRISAIGIHVFRLSNPEVANLFAGLIPSSSKVEAEAGTESQEK